MNRPLQHDQFRIKTPQGNEIVARVENGQVMEPKVVQRDGAMLPLDEKVALALANAMQASDISQRTQLEVDSIKQTLDGFGALAKALGNDNPAIRPHYEQLQITETIAQQMAMQAKSFEMQAGRIADKEVEKHDPRLHEGNTGHGLAVNLSAKKDSPKIG